MKLGENSRGRKRRNWRARSRKGTWELDQHTYHALDSCRNFSNNKKDFLVETSDWWVLYSGENFDTGLIMSEKSTMQAQHSELCGRRKDIVAVFRKPWIEEGWEESLEVKNKTLLPVGGLPSWLHWACFPGRDSLAHQLSPQQQFRGWLPDTLEWKSQQSWVWEGLDTPDSSAESLGRFCEETIWSTCTCKHNVALTLSKLTKGEEISGGLTRRLLVTQASKT